MHFHSFSFCLAIDMKVATPIEKTAVTVLQLYGNCDESLNVTFIQRTKKINCFPLLTAGGKVPFHSPPPRCHRRLPERGESEVLSSISKTHPIIVRKSLVLPTLIPGGTELFPTRERKRHSGVEAQGWTRAGKVSSNR